MTLQTTTYTFREFEALQTRSSQRMELVEGKVIITPLTEAQQKIAKRLAQALEGHVRPRRLGSVALGMGYRRANDLHNVRFPDVSFISYERTQPLPSEGYTPYMPDIAVLVKSPHLSLEQIAQRAIYFLENGSSLTWVVNPEVCAVDIYSRQTRRQMRVFKVHGSDNLVGGDVLPNFTLPVQELFAK